MDARIERPGHRGHLRRFAGGEDGAMILLGLIFLMLMLMMGGLAVDLMRFEATRTQLQQTSDRAALAAASLKQKLDPEAVVRDYFEKAGLLENLKSVKVEETFNSKTVTIDATSAVTPFFTQMIGIDEMDAPAASKAVEKISDVEIALVLDVSGSMQGAKLTNLKSAAAEFVETVLANDTENRISITIVPYNMKVKIGPDLLSRYTGVTALNGQSDFECIDFPATVYTSLAMPAATAMPQTGYFDDTSSANSSGTYQSILAPSDSVARSDCRPGNVILPPTNNIATLKARINGLVANGNTSIMAGMRWGTTLIDPQTRPVMESLIGSSIVSNAFSGRPYDYDRENTLKVIVLMTDGEHTDETAMKDPYRSGPSGIYKSTGDGYLSIYHAGKSGTSKYWVPHLSSNNWQATPYQKASAPGYTELDWRDVWKTANMKWVAYQLYTRPMGTSVSTMIGNFRTTIVAGANSTSAKATMNSQLQSVCTLVKQKGVTVFGIAFEAPTNGQTQIRNCASSTGHYFNATGLQIATAFRTIASQISTLRLTQ